MSNFRLDQKVAIVTGAGSGIGKSIALTFAANGAYVHVLDIQQEQAEGTVNEIATQGGQAMAHRCDVADQAAVIDLANAIQAQHPIHILVNNAGIGLVGNVEKTTEADFDRLYQVNVKGVYNCLYAFVPHLKANGGGVILNMASIVASVGIPDRFAYSMTKGAVLTMTYSVAVDYIQHNIRCNCISPARVHTAFVDAYLAQNYPGAESEMFEKLSKTQPIGRMGKPEEVADLALFLCSDAASFITGCDYPVDGGFIKLVL